MAPSAPDAAALAGEGNRVIGWKLDAEQRSALLAHFRPRYRNPVADHVTLQSGTADDAPLPQETAAEIVGRADNGRGVEAMVVAIGGSIDRPDGGTYHITWSLEDGRRARESNDVIAEQGWARFDRPVSIELTPARF